MSSYAQLLLRGREISSFRNDIDPTFLLLFTKENLVRLRGEDVRAHAQFDPDWEDQEIVLLQATAGELRDRFDALGMGRSVIERWYRDLRDSDVSRWDGMGDPGLLTKHRTEMAAFWRDRPFATWVQDVRTHLETPYLVRGGRMDVGTFDNLLSIWNYADHRFALRAVLEAVDADELVELNVSELHEGGWLDDPFDPQAIATEHFSYVMSNGAPAIILTEGSSDVYALQFAIRVLKPHLGPWVRIPL